MLLIQILWRRLQMMVFPYQKALVVWKSLFHLYQKRNPPKEKARAPKTFPLQSLMEGTALSSWWVWRWPKDLLPLKTDFKKKHKTRTRSKRLSKVISTSSPKPLMLGINLLQGRHRVHFTFRRWINSRAPLLKSDLRNYGIKFLHNNL